MTTIYLIRHAQSEFNKRDVDLQTTSVEAWGEYQSPLTKFGHEQAKKLASKLAPIHFHSIYASDLTRARETAEYMIHGRSVGLILVSSIRERTHGIDFLSNSAERKQQIENEILRLSEIEKMQYRYSPDGETAHEAVMRLTSFIGEISPKHTKDTIAIVNHGNLMRMFLISIGWARYEELPHNSIENTGYVVLQTNGIEYVVTETKGVNKKVY